MHKLKIQEEARIHEVNILLVRKGATSIIPGDRAIESASSRIQ